MLPFMHLLKSRTANFCVTFLAGQEVIYDVTMIIAQAYGLSAGL